MQTSNTKLSINFDLRFIIIVLLLTIAGMLVLWRPWEGQVDANARTVEVTGETTVKSEPDEFVFYPTYEFTNADKTAGLAELTKKSDAVINELKKLGVPDNKIKTDSNGYGDSPYYPAESNDKTTYYLSLTVRSSSREEATKIQNYLVGTSPTGSVSPQATFSDKKRNELEQTARDDATKDARAKADQSANNLGFKVGKVKSVTDGPGFRGESLLNSTDIEATTDLAVQPGENELSYSVTVVYFVK